MGRTLHILPKCCTELSESPLGGGLYAVVQLFRQNGLKIEGGLIRGGGLYVGKDGKAKHNKTTYETRTEYKRSLSTPYFRDAEKYGDVYEVQKRKQKTFQNMPIQVSTAILQYAKLRLLQFVYEFLYKYVDKTNFNIMYCDTDSLYMAITSENFEDLIKPELKEEFFR